MFYYRVHGKYSHMSAQTHAVCSRLNIITSLSLLLVFLSLSLLCSFQKCSFLPRFQVKIETHFQNDNGCNENVSERWQHTHTHSHTLSHTVCVLTGDNPLKGGRFISGTRSFRVLVKAIELVSVSEALSNSQARSKHFTFLL